MLVWRAYLTIICLTSVKTISDRSPDLDNDSDDDYYYSSNDDLSDSEPTMLNDRPRKTSFLKVRPATVTTRVFNFYL